MVRKQIDPKKDVKAFLVRVGKNIREKREEFGLNQTDVAGFVGCDDTLVSKWERGKTLPRLSDIWQLCTLFQCSFDTLLGDETSHIPDASQIPYPRPLYVHTNALSHLKTPDTERDLKNGVELLEACLQGKTLEDLYALPGLEKYRANKDMVIAFLRAALLSGEITFTFVPRSSTLEARMAEQYPQLAGSVIVVDLPESMIGEALPPELIGWTAAHHVLSHIDKPSRVGFGNGYTLYRMCANTLPKAQQFSGTQWIPLITYRHDEEVTVNSANFLAAFMRHRHHNSAAAFLPYVPVEEQPISRQLEQMRRDWERLNVAFVSGYGWSKEDNTRVPTSYRGIYRMLESTREINRLAGEFLGYVLDTEGNIVGTDTLQAMNGATTRIPLEALQECIANTGKVYFVGGTAKKAPIVRVALMCGYVNGLITDSRLAKELLK